MLIDPVNTHIDDYLAILSELGLQLKDTLETHVHADHITASGLARKRLGAQTGGGGGALCGAETADIQIKDGDADTEYDGITQRLFTPPADTLVYPGHDYQQRWVSNIMQEWTTNPRLTGKTREQNTEIMNNVSLPKPKLIDGAVPVSRYYGLAENERQHAVAHRDTARDEANTCEIPVVNCGGELPKTGE